jgi:predicted RNase H-like nuclease (RuvC/YqgF family)
MRALRAYQLFKHVEVFDPIIASQCPKRAREAEELKRKCIEIGQQYEEHVRRWTLTGPAHSWPRYLGDAEHIIGRLRAHLAEEAKRIDQLIAGLQRTRQPPSNVRN